VVTSPTWITKGKIVKNRLATALFAIMGNFGTDAAAAAGASHAIPLPAHGVIRQVGINTCGVAAVAMLLRSSHLVVPDSIWREEMPGPNGLSATQLVGIAKRHGLTLTTFQAPVGQYYAFATPWIAHLFAGQGHFVVVEGASPTAVIVADPNGGRFLYTAEQFKRAWTGHALVPVLNPRTGKAK